ncbi:hypothetical protein BD310DRAFT_914396 [Dichomitus squalens]|uniref:Uncharacterized protein n=1 Tax=Dichomitus squalens TaxID=114155 RepID=A0A4Q9Q9Q7_9APHY|nr:hypothetical protein BD310DRAFT_914396 [Dichomitus squalens]
MRVSRLSFHRRVPTNVPSVLNSLRLLGTCAAHAGSRSAGELDRSQTRSIGDSVHSSIRSGLLSYDSRQCQD